MKSFKDNMSLILPLCAVLFVLQLYIIFDRVIKIYENNINLNYSIVVTAKSKLDIQTLKKSVPGIKNIALVPSSEMIDRLKINIPNVDILALKESLPNFYSISLHKFPNKDELANIKSSITNYPGIDRIETFQRKYTQVHRLLLIVGVLLEWFTYTSFVICTLLMIKHINNWRLEHQERINIMKLFGASYWTKNSFLFNIALIDTIISVLVVIVAFNYLLIHEQTVSLIKDLDIKQSFYFFAKDSLILLLVGLGLSMVSVVFASYAKNDK